MLIALAVPHLCKGTCSVGSDLALQAWRIIHEFSIDEYSSYCTFD
jgi:hypothetical protein